VPTPFNRSAADPEKLRRLEDVSGSALSRRGSDRRNSEALADFRAGRPEVRLPSDIWSESAGA
jgi:hypothetical protein